jgi:hypothetical protein
MIAVPRLMGADAVYPAWRARCERRIDKRLSDQVLTSRFLIVAFTYCGNGCITKAFISLRLGCGVSALRRSF